MKLDVQPNLAGHSHREAPRRQRLADEPSVQPPPSRHSPTIHFKMHSSITPTSPVRSDCWTRYIGVGNMFSGLEIPFEDRPELQPDKVDVTRHTSHVTRHTSHVTRHTSHVTRHTSHVTRHIRHTTLGLLSPCPATDHEHRPPSARRGAGQEVLHPRHYH
jgi:hypothetical protein